MSSFSFTIPGKIWEAVIGKEWKLQPGPQVKKIGTGLGDRSRLSCTPGQQLKLSQYKGGGCQHPGACVRAVAKSARASMVPHSWTLEKRWDRGSANGWLSEKVKGHSGDVWEVAGLPIWILRKTIMEVAGGEGEPLLPLCWREALRVHVSDATGSIPKRGFQGEGTSTSSLPSTWTKPNKNTRGRQKQLLE